MIEANDGAKLEEVLESWEDAQDGVTPGLDRRIKECLRQNEERKEQELLLQEQGRNATALSGEEDNFRMLSGPIRILKRPKSNKTDVNGNRVNSDDVASSSAVPGNGPGYRSIAERVATYNEVRFRIFGSPDPEYLSSLQSIQNAQSVDKGTAWAKCGKKRNANYWANRRM
uniref:SUZ domain-containing protein n=1 Tax=Trichuris muris TaxID=70415 RepID=A0A5S6QBF7_TRIMR